MTTNPYAAPEAQGSPEGPQPFAALDWLGIATARLIIAALAALPALGFRAMF